MNNPSIPRLLPFAARLILIFGLIVGAGARAATLGDFGHQNMKVNGHAALGPRPTVVILLDLANTGSFAHSAAYYDNLVFNLFNTNSAGVRSLYGYMLVNSHSRFSLVRAGPGLIGPLQLPADQRAKALTNDVMQAGFAIAAAVNAGVNLAPYDADGNGTITADEVAVLVFDNFNTVSSGATRWANPSGTGGGFTPAGSTVSFSLPVALVSQRVDFATLCHEFSHATLNAKDLYGGLNGETVCYNYDYTPMICTISAPDDMLSFGLDAWHKMQLGWVDPRIRSLSAGGAETVAAAQAITATDAPIILYDPGRGTKEFFLMEYRTSTSPEGAGYEDNLSSNGLGIWHIIHDANNNEFQLASGVPSVSLEGQPDLQPGEANLLWTSHTTTPLLHWSDGTVTHTRITVRRFNTGDGSILVEWTGAADIWADFQYNGTELGTFAQPFNTLGEAVNAASYGDTVKFKTSGSSAETLALSKRLNLIATGGAVTIGR